MLRGQPVVVRFARCEREPGRQAAAIDHRMYLAGETSSRPAMDCLLLQAMQAAC